MRHASEFIPHPDNPYSELDNFFAAVYWEAEKEKEHANDSQQLLCELSGGNNKPESKGGNPGGSK